MSTKIAVKDNRYMLPASEPIIHCISIWMNLTLPGEIPSTLTVRMRRSRPDTPSVPRAAKKKH